MKKSSSFNRYLFNLLAFLTYSILIGSGALQANESDADLAAKEEIRKLSSSLQNLKQDVITLNKELRIMEEALLYPSSTKVSVFLTVSSGQFFKLNSIKLKLNGDFVAAHLYTEDERQALLQGGVQRLYVTNLNKGKHTATAFFYGEGPNGREYKRGVDISFDKGDVSAYMELVVTDDGSIQEPVFEIKQW